MDVVIRLYYECQAHGLFIISRGLGDKWPREHQCPHCGSLSKRDYKLTSVKGEE